MKFAWISVSLVTTRKLSGWELLKIISTFQAVVVSHGVYHTLIVLYRWLFSFLAVHIDLHFYVDCIFCFYFQRARAFWSNYLLFVFMKSIATKAHTMGNHFHSSFPRLTVSLIIIFFFCVPICHASAFSCNHQGLLELYWW